MKTNRRGFLAMLSSLFHQRKTLPKLANLDSLSPLSGAGVFKPAMYGVGIPHPAKHYYPGASYGVGWIISKDMSGNTFRKTNPAYYTNVSPRFAEIRRAQREIEEELCNSVLDDYASSESGQPDESWANAVQLRPTGLPSEHRDDLDAEGLLEGGSLPKPFLGPVSLRNTQCG